MQDEATCDSENGGWQLGCEREAPARVLGATCKAWASGRLVGWLEVPVASAWVMLSLLFITAALAVSRQGPRAVSHSDPLSPHTSRNVSALGFTEAAPHGRRGLDGGGQSYPHPATWHWAWKGQVAPAHTACLGEDFLMARMLRRGRVASAAPGPRLPSRMLFPSLSRS